MYLDDSRVGKGRMDCDYLQLLDLRYYQGLPTLVLTPGTFAATLVNDYNLVTIAGVPMRARLY